MFVRPHIGGGLRTLARVGAVGGPRPLIRPGVLSGLTLSRAQTGGVKATYWNGTTWVEADADVPRFEPSGLLIEGQRTNLVTDPRFGSAVAGAPGTLPTGMAHDTLPSGVTRTISLSSASGAAVLTFSYAGTAGSTAQSTFAWQPAASAGSIYSPSVSVLTSGSLAGLTGGGIVINSTYRDAGQSSLATNCTQATGVAPTTWTRYPAAGTTAPATTALVDMRVRMNFVAGVSYNFAVSVLLPQIELGAVAGTPILPPVGTPGASTRGADLVSATLASLGIGGNGACTVLWSGVIDSLTADNRIIQIDNGSDASRYRLLTTTANLVVAGGSSTTVGTIVAGTPFRCGMTIDGAGRVAGCLNSGAIVSNTGGAAASFTTFRLGMNSGGTTPIWGKTGHLRVLPFALPDAALRAHTAAMPVLT